ncbi:MAG: isoamylase early set domain-containing protein [Gemmatimonadota bacterium]|nr:isoamylase early set domain-containing protein [Gemmatimonadota bacterium]
MIDRDGRMEANPRADSGEAPLDPVELAFVAKLRERVPIRDDFNSSVMNAVRAEPVHRSAQFAISRGKQRAYIATTLFGLALAASVAFVVSGNLLHRTEPPATASPVAAVASAPVLPAVASRERTVHFKLVRAGASRVSVAGSFNGWNASQTPLRKVSPDTWEVEVPLSSGRYVYQFVVDGKQWVADPHAPRDAADDFGATNSVVTVASGASS